MPKRYPGALWKPCPDGGAMERLDGCTWHEAVTRASSLYGWVQTARACHLFNGKGGNCEQYIDVGRVAWGVAAGNSRMLTVESYDGLKIEQNPYREIGIGGVYGASANTGRWDDGQCERAADIMAWLHVEYGIPLRMMTSSALSEKGHAPHRWGIDPWRKSGGQVWTAHAGKPCPGDLRVKQLPRIVARAQQIAAAVKAGRCDWLPKGPVNVAAALARTGKAAAVQAGATYTVRQGDTLSDIAEDYGTTVPKLVALNGISNPDQIEVGQVIHLAAKETTVTKPSAPTKPQTPQQRYDELADQYGIGAAAFGHFRTQFDKIVAATNEGDARRYLVDFNEMFDGKSYTAAQWLHLLRAQLNVEMAK